MYIRKDKYIPESEWRNIPTPFKGENTVTPYEQEYIDFYMDNYDESELDIQEKYINELQDRFYEQYTREEIVEIFNKEIDLLKVVRKEGVDGPKDRWVADDLLMVIPLVILYEIYYLIIPDVERVERDTWEKIPILYKGKRMYLDVNLTEYLFPRF